MITNVRVCFKTQDSLLQKLMDAAEEKSLRNLKDFAGRTVLIEGGGYEKIWLETQPMGGEMYAKRNMEAALNNQLLFMEYAREDGRMPGSIAMEHGRITPQFNKFQGFCFPAPALNMYYLMGRDPYYLELLYQTLERFDAYLWRVRDSDGDGCLESWCKYDTGEDHALRYGDAPDWWTEEKPPTDKEVVPMASIDFMSYSFSARDTLAKISRIQGQPEREAAWRSKAEQVRQRISAYLWNDEVGACLDRDKRHAWLPTLTHNSLRAMYWGSLTKAQADRFVREHLLNPKEFWTRMPLPSVAVNDPLFRNVTTNDWSGQPQALTYQRAIRALENYGYDWLIPVLGRRLCEAIGEACVFVQQYDPFTGCPSKISLADEQDGYGPAMLSVMEYLARCHGVHIEGEEVFWGAYGGAPCTYCQEWGEYEYSLECDGKHAVLSVNGRIVLEADAGYRYVTDLEGALLRKHPLK